MTGQRFIDKRGNVWTLIERKTTDGDNYCLSSHHLVSMKTCYGKTIEEVCKLAEEDGMKLYYGRY